MVPRNLNERYGLDNITRIGVADLEWILGMWIKIGYGALGSGMGIRIADWGVGGRIGDWDLGQALGLQWIGMTFGIEIGI